MAEGEMYLPFDRHYEFTLQSFRLALVFLNGELLLDQGNTSDRTAARTAFRKAGAYRIRIEQYVWMRRASDSPSNGTCPFTTAESCPIKRSSYA